MQEFAFELALCAHLETSEQAVLGRQLGTQVHGRRVMDVVRIEPGPAFDERTAITPESIPSLAIESDVGPGTARYWKDAFDCHPDTAEQVIERAVDVGFFERERRNSRTYVRQTTRYPDWFDTVVGIENKPDLGRPGDLETQLLTDVALSLVDKIVLATESYVTGAHRNRIPPEVGIWRFDPETGDREILREADQLPVDEAGIEILDRSSARTEIRVASAGAIERARRRVAERAYGKGWRTYDLPDCEQMAPDDAGLPYCPWKGETVRPATECGPDCGGYCSGDAPSVDFDALRAQRSPWEPDPAGRKRRQSGLDSFL
ncbi:DUF5787 family protein [Halovenus salina]|uniref:DUF5787 family protein n=1 Tax=Halovenus salina TaxID=1510225 RepID=UPI00226102E8|nr:DUF5787 family protein [Halovenus salina]